MMIRRITLAAALMSMMLASTPAFAGGPKGQRGPGPDAVIAKLGIDDARAAKIKKIMKQARADGEVLRATLKKEKRELHEMFKGGATETEIRAQANKVQSIKNDAFQHRLDTKLAVRKLLTPDERAKFHKMMKKRGKKKGKRGKRKGRRDLTPAE